MLLFKFISDSFANLSTF